MYGKYAIRHSTSYLAQDLVGSSTINLAQLRATYRLGYNFDLVGEARWLNQPSANHSETGFVIEGGYYLTPNLRLSAGYAFGNVDDEDFSGSRSAGGLYAGLTVKLNELFDGFGLQKPAPAQQQESKVKPVASKATEQQKLKERLAHYAPAQPQQQNDTPATTEQQKLKQQLRQAPAQPVPQQNVTPATPETTFTVAPETIPYRLGEPAIPNPAVTPKNIPAQSGEMS